MCKVYCFTAYPSPADRGWAVRDVGSSHMLFVILPLFKRFSFVLQRGGGGEAKQLFEAT